MDCHNDLPKTATVALSMFASWLLSMSLSNRQRPSDLRVPSCPHPVQRSLGKMGRSERSSRTHSLATRPMTERMGHGMSAVRDQASWRKTLVLSPWKLLTRGILLHETPPTISLHDVIVIVFILTTETSPNENNNNNARSGSR